MLGCQWEQGPGLGTPLQLNEHLRNMIRSCTYITHSICLTLNLALLELSLFEILDTLFIINFSALIFF